LENLICLCIPCHNKHGHGDDECKRHNIRCPIGKIDFSKYEE